LIKTILQPDNVFEHVAKDALAEGSAIPVVQQSQEEHKEEMIKQSKKDPQVEKLQQQRVYDLSGMPPPPIKPVVRKRIEPTVLKEAAPMDVPEGHISNVKIYKTHEERMRDVR
jgi:hypothetical protein